MKLIFVNSNDQIEILDQNTDVSLLKTSALEHYTGEDILIWMMGPSGKKTEELDPSQCIEQAELEDGSSYIINKI